MSRTERDRRLLSSVPDSDGAFSLPSTLTIRLPARARATADNLQVRAYKPELALRGVEGGIPLDKLPFELLKVAQSPIVKGGQLGIVGNVKEVIEARRLVHECLRIGDEEEIGAKCDKWKERMCVFDRDFDPVDGGGDETGLVGKKRRGKRRMRWKKSARKAAIDLPLLCPSCRSPI